MDVLVVVVDKVPLLGIFGKIIRFVSLYKTISAGEIIAKLEINFLANHLETVFEGKTNSLKLSAAFAVIAQVSFNFASIREEVNLTKDHSEVSQSLLRNVVTVIKSGNKTPPTPVQVLDGRTILSRHHRTTSISTETIEMCEHLFDKRFGDHILSLLGLSSTQTLATIIHKIYIGRCILGLKKSVKNQWFSEQKHENERDRILALINSPESKFYTKPIL